MARLSNSNVLDQIAKFFLLLSEAPSYWYSINTCFKHQLLIVASSSVAIIVVNLIRDDAPHNTPAVDCCVQQCQLSSLSLSWRWSWVTVMWCTKVGHCHPLRPLISSLPPWSLQNAGFDLTFFPTGEDRGFKFPRGEPM